MAETESSEQPDAPPQVTEEEPARMTDEEIVQFVLNFCDGQIFSLHHIPPSDEDMVRMVFMPVAFGALSGNKAFLEKIGTLWEYLSQAGPRSINGYPIFMSVRIMHQDDWARARTAILAEQQRRAELKV